MTDAAHPELETLACVLARLLAVWWQEKLRQTNDMQSRAPPGTDVERTEDQFDSQADMSIDAAKE